MNVLPESLKGSTALITGAASGIGLATAQYISECGVGKLILVDRSSLLCNFEKSKMQFLQGDVSDDQFWKSNQAAMDGINLAVINAGVSSAGAIVDLDFAEWKRVMAVNLDGAFLTLQACMKAMTGKGGAIVMVSSATGLKAEMGTAAYGSSKAALLQLMRVAAKEGAKQGIRVNAIAPAGVETPMWRSMPFFQELVKSTGSESAAFDQIAKAGTPLGRFATATDIARQITFLLSDAAGTITGATLISDGGYLL